MSMLYIGVDIGGTATKYGVFTVEGKLISKWEAPTALGQHGSGILPAVAGQLTSWVASHGYAMGADCRGRRWHTWTGAE